MDTVCSQCKDAPSPKIQAMTAGDPISRTHCLFPIRNRADVSVVTGSHPTSHPVQF